MLCLRQDQLILVFDPLNTREKLSIWQEMVCWRRIQELVNDRKRGEFGLVFKNGSRYIPAPLKNVDEN